MASGKQVLLSVLQEYSQRKTEKSDLDEVTDRVKAALLVHCSSSNEALNKVEKLAWLSQDDGNGPVKQGLGLSSSGVFLSDIFEELVEDDELPERLKKRFPALTQDDFSDALEFIWWLLSAVQFWNELSSVENEGNLDLSEREKLVNGYRKMLKHFRNDPMDC